jgi:hypothetical protein
MIVLEGFFEDLQLDGERHFLSWCFHNTILLLVEVYIGYVFASHRANEASIPEFLSSTPGYLRLFNRRDEKREVALSEECSSSLLTFMFVLLESRSRSMRRIKPDGCGWRWRSWHVTRVSETTGLSIVDVERWVWRRVHWKTMTIHEHMNSNCSQKRTCVSHT